jgi:hypothetical protein
MFCPSEVLLASVPTPSAIPFLSHGSCDGHLSSIGRIVTISLG